MYAYFRDAIHTHFVTLIGKWTISFLPTHPVFLSSIARDGTKLLYSKYIVCKDNYRDQKRIIAAI